MSRQPPIRIAHGYGNRRRLLEQALARPVDYVEADIWYRAGRVWVRHEQRLGIFPILYDQRGSQPSIGPYAVSLGPWYVRLDSHPFSLEELLARVKGRCGVLLDVKGLYRPADQRAFAVTLARLLAEHSMEQQARTCGQNWAVLQEVRQVAPHLTTHFSIETPQQWGTFVRQFGAGDPVDGVCLQRSLIDEEKTRWLTERGIQTFSWTVDQDEEARRLLALGIAGIISNNLALLGQLQALVT